MIKNRIKVAAGVGVFCLALSFSSIVETTYTRNAIVVNVNDELVTVEDESKNLWNFLGSEFKKGEAVKLIMDDNHTHSIQDDTIKDVKKNELKSLTK